MFRGWKTVNYGFLQWQNMTREVPQVSVMGPVVFNMSINNMEKWVTTVVQHPVDDTKIFKVSKIKAD